MASVKPYFKVTKLSKCTQKHTYKQSNAWHTYEYELYWSTHRNFLFSL
jgi:hypothetical protein